MEINELEEFRIVNIWRILLYFLDKNIIKIIKVVSLLIFFTCSVTHGKEVVYLGCVWHFAPLSGQVFH